MSNVNIITKEQLMVIINEVNAIPNDDKYIIRDGQEWLVCLEDGNVLAFEPEPTCSFGDWSIDYVTVRLANEDNTTNLSEPVKLKEFDDEMYMMMVEYFDRSH